MADSSKLLSDVPHYILSDGRLRQVHAWPNRHDVLYRGSDLYAALESVQETVETLRRERDELKDDLARNARMLARQCDLAREAESTAMAAEADCTRLRADRDRLQQEQADLTEMLDTAHRNVERLILANHALSLRLQLIAAPGAE